MSFTAIEIKLEKSMGYSKTNPHTPDGTLEILVGGGGGEGSGNPGRRGGLGLKILLWGSFSL